jgi:glutathione synthase/RimK-type ligase-like ATP-grasp enzyme
VGRKRARRIENRTVVENNSLKESEIMWTKIQVVHGNQKIIYLPASFAMNNGLTTEIQLGGRSTEADIEYREDFEWVAANSFENPGKIMLTDKLKDELLLAESLVYQVQITASRIDFGPVIGLLLGNATQRYHPAHMMKYSDRFGIYPQIGGLIYAFSPGFINWEEDCAFGLYYNPDAAAWEYGNFPLPEVIYRRDFHTDPEVIQRLDRYTKGRLFNSYRFTKVELFDFVRQDAGLRNYLPPTEYLTGFEQLMQFLNLYRKVILKPVHLSRGRGICVIEKTDSKYKVMDFRCKAPVAYELYDDQLLEHFFQVFREFFANYLIQKYIALAEIDNSPFDIRAVMHKRPDRKWVCSGIECRVSHNGYLTNISKGGHALPLDLALQQASMSDAAVLTEEIDRLCRNFCTYMDTSGEHYAEFGLDIAIDAEHRLWLIEANVFPSFKGFKQIDLDTYLSIRYHPMLYASSLTHFGKDYPASNIRSGESR